MYLCLVKSQLSIHPNSFIEHIWLLRGVPTTSRIILLVLSVFWSSGVICLFQLKLMLWAWLSSLMSPFSSLLTFIVLSALLK